MKYTDKYPNIRPPSPGYQENYKDQSVLAEENLRYTDRWSVCFICRDKTPFSEESYQHFVHICSEECRAVLKEWNSEYPDPKNEVPPEMPYMEYGIT